MFGDLHQFMHQAHERLSCLPPSHSMHTCFSQVDEFCSAAKPVVHLESYARLRVCQHTSEQDTSEQQNEVGPTAFLL